MAGVCIDMCLFEDPLLQLGRVLLRCTLDLEWRACGTFDGTFDRKFDRKFDRTFDRTFDLEWRTRLLVMCVEFVADTRR